MSLDDFVTKVREEQERIISCEHEWGPNPGFSDLGQKCIKCTVCELPWLRNQLFVERVRNAELMAALQGLTEDVRTALGRWPVSGRR